MKKLTTAQKVKIKGFKNLKELSDQESRSTFTLRSWDKNKPELFDAFLIEAIKRKKGG
jgi:hypothetical protein